MAQVDHDPPADSLAEERATYAGVTWRLLPILFLCYVIGYIDRVNVGFAKLQMLHDLHFSETTYGLGAGIFFLGYFCCELPSNLALSRIGARKWLARIMITWGIISASMMFVRTPASFYILRCLLGMAEAGLFPGVILYLTYWYPSHRRGKMVALFMAAQPVSGLVGGPLSGWILQSLQGMRHLAGWQWLFLLEALPAILMGLVLFYWLDDGILDANWLSPNQKQILKAHIETESEHKHNHGSILAVLRSRWVWLMGLISFSSVMGLYGVGFWLPSIIKSTGVEKPLNVGLLTMIPYGVSILAMILVSRSADHTGERRWHLAISTIVGGVGLILSTLYGGNTVVAMVGLTIATAGIITSQPLFWNLPTAYLGATSAAAGIAAINCIANLAGFVSPYLVGWIKDLTQSTTAGMYVLAFWLFLGSALALLVPATLVNDKPRTKLTIQR